MLCPFFLARGGRLLPVLTQGRGTDDNQGRMTPEEAFKWRQRKRRLAIGFAIATLATLTAWLI